MWHQCNLAAKESGLECACVNNDDFTVLVSGAVDTTEWVCVLCGCHIQNDWASRATNLRQILCEAWMFLHGNYSDDSEGCSYGQLVIGSFIITMHSLIHHASCSLLAKHQITQVTQPPFVVLRLLAIPKTKITFEREEISDHWWDSGKYNKAADGYWENCVRSQGAYFEGDWGVIVLCTMFLVSSSINVSIFYITWLYTFWIDVCVYLI